MINQFIEEKVKEFDAFMVPEYGKWKIGRLEAKTYLTLSLHALLAEIEKEITSLVGGVDEIGMPEIYKTQPIAFKDGHNIGLKKVIALLKTKDGNS